MSVSQPHPAAQRRALIFVNGELHDLAAVRALVQPGDYRVAADGGTRHLLNLGLLPDVVVGDLDSLTAAEVENLKNQLVRVEQHPVHKNETDLELAVETALREGCSKILILGALGGRLDMTLANIFLLTLPELAGVDVRLEDGREEVFMIRPQDQARSHSRAGGRPGLPASPGRPGAGHSHQWIVLSAAC